MDRRERLDDAVESLRTAQDGKQAEMWTALPGLVEHFDPVAMTVSVQPAVMGRMEDEAGAVSSVALPLLVDVPVVFPCGGGFTLTYPIRPGDEALVIFASRCIDGWWQAGGIGSVPDMRMHDLSDGIAIVGPRSQPRKLTPAVDADNVQLRTDDGRAHITMMPDYTIRAENPAAKITMTPGGEITAEADTRIALKAPYIAMQARSYSLGGYGGGRAVAVMDADLKQTGWHTSTGDQAAGGKSLMHHTHPCDSGSTGEAQ